jgi:hypothetical protein
MTFTTQTIADRRRIFVRGLGVADGKQGCPEV